MKDVSINGFPMIGNMCDLPNILVTAQNRTIINCTIIGQLFFPNNVPNHTDLPDKKFNYTTKGQESPTCNQQTE